MTQRSDQLSEVIKSALGEILLRELELPRNSLVTITKVEITPELDHAKIWISILPETAEKEVFALIRRNVKTFQYHLAKKIVSRIVPTLFFVVDHGEQYASHIDHLLDDLSRTS